MNITRDELNRILKRDGYALIGNDDAQPNRKAIATPATESPLEARFLMYWTACDGPELQREYKFHPVRKWRADFHHPQTRTLIEVEGGLYSQGRHNRAHGFMADADKYLEAWMLGYSVIRLTSKQITMDTVQRIARHLQQEV